MTLDADIVVDRPRFTVRARLSVADDEVVAIVGPNGAGKTTLLFGLTGLVPRRGSVESKGAIGIVFQDRRLFPHMSVLDNVAFAAGRTEAARWLARLGAGHLAALRPNDLSGGQAQRVAVARALAASPSALVLDEPFTALDIDSRAAVAAAIAAFDGPRVIVTHAPLEAATAADRVVVLEDGRVVQEGTLSELAAHPRSPYVAEFVGVNRLPGWATGIGGEVRLDGGGVLIGADPMPAGAVAVTLHPRAIALHDRRPAGSPRNVVAGRVVEIDRFGDRVRLTVSGPPRLVAEITATAAAELSLAPGCEVWAAVKATEVTVIPA